MNKSMAPIVMMAIRKVYELFLFWSENKILEIKKKKNWTVKKIIILMFSSKV